MRISIYILFVFLNSSILLSQISPSSFHPFSGKVIVSSEFGYTHSYTDYVYPRPELFGRGTIEYFFPSKSIHAFGIKVNGGLGSITAYSRKDNQELINPNFYTSIFALGTGITYARKLGYSIPYLSFFISHIRINPKDRNGKLLQNNFDRKYKLNNTMYTAELGVRFLVEDFWSFNLGLNYNITNTDYLDDLKNGVANDDFLALFFGISLYYGGEKDTDRDGIEDSKDVCPDTPNGLEVDSFGCPLDQDSDGILDYLDDCPNTPKNILITEFGCPKDDDEDGIPNYLDQCPNSIPNAQVDSNGCFKENQFDIKEEFTIDTVSTENKVEQIKQYDLNNEKMLNDAIFTDGTIFCYQVGSFKSKYSAENLLIKLVEKGHNAFIVEASLFKNQEIWFRVRVGYFNTLKETKKYKNTFSD